MATHCPEDVITVSNDPLGGMIAYTWKPRETG